MGIYKQTYYVSFIENINLEPDDFCNKLAELFFCNVEYILNSDDENTLLPKNKNYNFGRKKTIQVYHSIYLENEYIDDSGTFPNIHTSINFDIRCDQIFNKKANILIDKSGFVEYYVDDIFWKSISLSYNNYFDNEMKKLILQNRPMAMYFLQTLGCNQALLLPDILTRVVQAFMDEAIEKKQPIKSFEEMKHILEQKETIHYYNLNNLLLDKEPLNKFQSTHQTGYLDFFI